MTRIGRYWIFFVIVAVGLALSWAQVGNKTRRMLLDEPLVYLNTDADCRPRVAPCAAVGGDRALVLGPGQTGLIARRTGLDANDLVSAEVIMFDGEGKELLRTALLADARDWRLGPLPDATHSLRIHIVAHSGNTVAEFPLGDASAGR